jgi:Flp pilus assembly pilin Flp
VGEALFQSWLLVLGRGRKVAERMRGEQGASMVEYALLVGLIALVAVFGLILLGPTVNNIFFSSGSCVTNLSNASCH